MTEKSIRDAISDLPEHISENSDQVELKGGILIEELTRFLTPIPIQTKGSRGEKLYPWIDQGWNSTIIKKTLAEVSSAVRFARTNPARAIGHANEALRVWNDELHQF